MMVKSKQIAGLTWRVDNIYSPYNTIVNTIFGWNYGPFYDIWGHNDDLALQEVKISYSDMTIDMTIVILGWN